MPQRKKVRFSSESAVKRPANIHVIKLAELRLQTVSVLVVGALAIVLVIAAVMIAVLLPQQSEQALNAVAATVSAAFTSLIWWSARK